MMTVEGRPPGPVAFVCDHGHLEHLGPCDKCEAEAAAEAAAAAPRRDVDQECPHHGTPPGVECLPCRRASDVGRPVGGGPRATRLFQAKVDSTCPICRSLIRAHFDKFGHHPKHDRVTCADCTPT